MDNLVGMVVGATLLAGVSVTAAEMYQRQAEEVVRIYEEGFFSTYEDAMKMAEDIQIGQ